jgi:hypothetical protein
LLPFVMRCVQSDVPRRLTSIFKALVQHGAQLEVRDAGGVTPLLSALGKGANVYAGLLIGECPISLFRTHDRVCCCGCDCVHPCFAGVRAWSRLGSSNLGQKTLRWPLLRLQAHRVSQRMMEPLTTYPWCSHAADHGADITATHLGITIWDLACEQLTGWSTFEALEVLLARGLAPPGGLRALTHTLAAVPRTPWLVSEQGAERELMGCWLEVVW